MDSSKSKHKICVSAVYRDCSKSIESFIWYHDSIDFDLVLVVDTTGTMAEKMVNSKLSTTKVQFLSATTAEAELSDYQLVNSLILPHCRKHCIAWLLHLDICDRVDLNGNFGDIHSFIDCRDKCDGLVILKVKPKCNCKGEARCIVKVDKTSGYECEWKWKYSNRACTIVRATTGEVYRDEYDRYQSVVRSKSGRSLELVQIVHHSYIDSKSWSAYLKSFISTSSTDDSVHDKDCHLYREEEERQ